MELVLLERVESLGLMGDIVTVKPGYARNYLLPQKKALRATPGNMAVFEARRAELEARNLERKGEAEGVAEKLEGFSVMLIRRAGDTGHLYGSVTVRDIAEAASEAGVEIDRRQLRLAQPIKSLGLHDITLQLHPEVLVPITANVARTLDEAEAQARGEDVLAMDDEDAYRFESGLSEFLEDGAAEGGESAPAEAGTGEAAVEEPAEER